jgi:hypothetical protein
MPDFFNNIDQGILRFVMICFILWLVKMQWNGCSRVQPTAHIGFGIGDLRL